MSRGENRIAAGIGARLRVDDEEVDARAEGGCHVGKTVLTESASANAVASERFLMLTAMMQRDG